MQLERGQFRITGRSVRLSPVGDCHREGARLAPGQIGQEFGDVDMVGSMVRRALHGRVGSVRGWSVPVSVHAELSIGWVSG